MVQFNQAALADPAKDRMFSAFFKTLSFFLGGVLLESFPACGGTKPHVSLPYYTCVIRPGSHQWQQRMVMSI